ncbi:tetratricopeptide repeat protein [Chloroflexi bacterium TSY]|nr:tetratricopeptide repeat protein [Chloroflexi bacterium TSY]
MARKSKKRKQDRKKQAFRRAQQKAQRPAGRVRDAMQLLQEGHTEEALNTAKVAFSGAKDASTKENVRSVLVEAHFRTAATKSKPTERLFHLDSALDLAPADDRLHYHRATTLMHLGEIERAEDALEQAAKINPNLSGLTSLSALINSAKEKYVNESEDSGIISTIKGIAKGQDLDRLLESLKKPVFDGQRDVWQALITMSQKPNVAPVDIFDSAITSVAQSDKHQVAALVKEDFPHVSPQIHYYRGVAAMRHKDSATALDAWNQASKGMETAWLQENLDNRLQEKVTDLGHAGEWSAVIDSYEGIPAEQKSKILSEAVSIARFHLGYVAAQQQKWSEAAEHWRIADNTLSNRYLLQNLALAEEALENWEQAATAWREMVKRRPRKKDHPDYLTDEQVAAVWRQAAKCYDRVDLVEEEIICLRNAIKYTPEDTDLRIKLADALLYDDHYEAAENELERILNVDPDYVPALIRLGATYKASWEHDPVPIWRKILTLDPENRQVRNLLAQAYVEHVNGGAWSKTSNALTADSP